MSNDKKQPQPKPRRSPEDFDHKLTFSLSQEDYLEYSRSQSAPMWKKTRKKTLIYLGVFVVLGIAALVRAQYTQDPLWKDIYSVGGVLLIVYQLFNVFYNFWIFPKAMERSVLKELKKDPRTLQEVTLCFDEEKIVSFCQGAHQSSFFYEDILYRKETPRVQILEMRNGKCLVLPKTVLEQADETIRQKVEGIRLVKMGI